MAHPVLAFTPAIARLGQRAFRGLEALDTQWLQQRARHNARRGLHNRLVLVGVEDPTGARRRPVAVCQPRPSAPADREAARVILTEAIASIETIAALVRLTPGREGRSPLAPSSKRPVRD